MDYGALLDIQNMRKIDMFHNWNAKRNGNQNTCFNGTAHSLITQRGNHNASSIPGRYSYGPLGPFALGKMVIG